MGKLGRDYLHHWDGVGGAAIEAFVDIDEGG